MTLATDTAAWVGAISGVVAAVAAIVGLWSVFRWFRPKFRARVGAHRQAIRVDVENRGRPSGWINKVAVVDSRLAELPAIFFGLDRGAFRRAQIPPRSSWHLIVRAPPSKPFPSDLTVLVEWGRRRRRQLAAEEASASYYGEELKSEWPET